MPKKKKDQIKNQNPENEKVEEEEIEELEEEGTPEPEPDLFAEFDGLELTGVKYSIYRKTETGENAFLYYTDPPCSIQQIATKFGGGKYTVFAKDKEGKITKKRTFDIDDSWNLPEEEDKKTGELEVLEKIKIYKSLFKDNDSSAILETAAKTMQVTNEMTQKMMLNHFELLNKINEMPEKNDALTDILGVIAGLLSGNNNILQLPGRDQKPGKSGSQVKNKKTNSG